MKLVSAVPHPPWARPAALALLVVTVGVVTVGCRGADERPLQPLLAPRSDAVAATPPPVTPTATVGTGSARVVAAPPEHLAARELFIPESTPAHLDPAKVHETSGSTIAAELFEGLLVPGVGDPEPKPGLAARHEVSADGLTWTFHLRPGLQWSDGAPLTAGDFVASWRRVLDPATASQGAQLLWVIDGARAYNDGSAPDAAKLGLHAPDDRTLVVRLAHPAPYFGHLVAEVPYAPTPPHVIDRHGDRWIRPEHAVSSGPFLLAEQRVRNRIVLEPNPRYHGADAVWLRRVTFLHYESETLAWQWYETGKVQVASQIPNELLDGLLGAGRDDLVIDPGYLCTYYYVMNASRPPFDDARVRRAFNRAIDKERLVRHVLGPGRRVATSVVHPGFAALGYPPTPGDGFDPEAARRLLAEAGFPGGAGFPEVTLQYNTFEGHRLIAEFVQRSVKEHLGVDLQIANMEWKSLLARLHGHDFQIARSSWCADYPDPLTFLDVFIPSSESNYGNYDAPEYTALVERIRAEPDPSRRRALIAAAEAVLNRDQPFLPIYFYARIYAVKPWVTGYRPHLMDRHPLRAVRFVGAAAGSPGAAP